MAQPDFYTSRREEEEKEVCATLWRQTSQSIIPIYTS